jgi:histidinol-phosphate phosphatase family protein
MKNRAVFLDRDGTLARDDGYCRRPEDFHLFPDAPKAVKLLNEHGFKIVVVTNQSGIARGIFTGETLEQIHKKMRDGLERGGAKVDSIYFCPHHPDDNCECRKPGTGLFRQAAKELDIDFKQSYMVGDMAKDIEAGKALGCRTIFVTTGPEKETSAQPDYIAENLYGAAEWIVKNTRADGRNSK